MLHFGDTDLFGLLPHLIPILSELGDSQAALYAYGCFNAGACITWLKDNIKLIKTPEETGDLALTANPEDHTILIPDFAGLGAPYWKPDMKAAFVGMTATTSKKELVRATLNSLVYQIADILAEFQKLPLSLIMKSIPTAV